MLFGGLFVFSNVYQRHPTPGNRIIPVASEKTGRYKVIFKI
jgi:hypothetical protein